jgi:ApbE superfamily uncharacterized protein (UPF0280 family)
MDYHERTYRNRIKSRHLSAFHVKVRETDLFISADHDCRNEAFESVYTCRQYLEEYIRHHPDFLHSLQPVAEDALAPAIINDMIRASRKSNVGPMASVAGAIAHYVGRDLLAYNHNVIVENGGDIFMRLVDDITYVGIFAGESPLSYRISLKVDPENTPMGICTSSGTVGHSLSLGCADAVCVLSKSTALADAAATFLGNIVKGEGDIRQALDRGSQIEGVNGILIIVKDKLGAWGDVELA